VSPKDEEIARALLPLRPGGLNEGAGGRAETTAFAQCSRKTQDKFAIASTTKKLLHRCIGAHERVVDQEIYIYIKFPPKNGVTPKLPSEVAQCL